MDEWEGFWPRGEAEASSVVSKSIYNASIAHCIGKAIATYLNRTIKELLFLFLRTSLVLTGERAGTAMRTCRNTFLPLTVVCRQQCLHASRRRARVKDLRHRGVKSRSYQRHQKTRLIGPIKTPGLANQPQLRYLHHHLTQQSRPPTRPL